MRSFRTVAAAANASGPRNTQNATCGKKVKKKRAAVIASAVANSFRTSGAMAWSMLACERQKKMPMTGYKYAPEIAPSRTVATASDTSSLMSVVVQKTVSVTFR